MEHKQLNRLIGGFIFLVALITYGMTVAPTTSYWDCGEFITCSYILGVPHPPGAPLYILIGRIFTMLPFWEDIGLRVNMISVLVSALSVMFLYLITVRLLKMFRGLPESVEDQVIFYSAAAIGALGFAFTDSFWFNAVEAEVYAVSLFFTAIVVWLIMRWVDKADEAGNENVLLFIAYLIGLATGIHLLNILAIPTLFLIIYFRKAELNLTTFVLWSLGAAAVFGAIYPVLVQGVPFIINEYSFLALGILALVVFLALVYSIRNQKHLASLFLMGMLLIAVGYSTYSALYIRSGMKPAINENHPDTPKKFVSYLNREQYGDIPVTERRAPMWSYQIKKMYIRYFGWQFIGKGDTYGADRYIVETLSLRGLMGLPFLVGFIGMVYHFSRDWKRASAVMALFIMTGVAISIYLNQEDPQPRERDYAYVGSFFAFAIWIGIGAYALLDTVRLQMRNASMRKIGLSATLLILIIAVPIRLFSDNYESHDRSGNYVAYNYSYNILQSCEPNAILFTNGDNDTFPLWFLQYVYGIRKDVRVVNLSLLNTDWYIKQLRDEEPKVPITFSDEKIESMQAVIWREPRKVDIPVSRARVLAEIAQEQDNASIKPEDIPEDPTVTWTLSHTKTISGHKVILVQDIMVVHILRANRFERPVYFAVTVAPSNMLGLDNRRDRSKPHNYLRMDGLAFRVMPYSGPSDFISPPKMHENLFTKFRFQNLDNPDVYYNENIIGLLQNYRSAFLRLSSYYLRKDENEKTLAVLDRMEAVMPESVIPLRNYQLSLQFGRMYADAGRPEELERRIEIAAANPRLTPYDNLVLAEFYSQVAKRPEKAESLTVALLEREPTFRQGYNWLVNHYTRTREYDKGVQLLLDYLALFPDDREFQNQLAAMKALQVRQQAADSAGSGSSNGE